MHPHNYNVITTPLLFIVLIFLYTPTTSMLLQRSVIHSFNIIIYHHKLHASIIHSFDIMYSHLQLKCYYNAPAIHSFNNIM